MLALAVLGLLAVASPADTAVRVPGTTLRFGLDDAAISARGFTASEPGTRKGRCRFFGLTSDATLTFEGGRLARAEFAVSGASPSELAYVEDQLTAMGYRRDCPRSTPKSRTCDYTARTRIHLEVNNASLSASVVPADRAVAPPPAPPGTGPSPASAEPRDPVSEAARAGPPAPVRAGPPAAGAAPVLPETLAVQVPGRASRYAIWSPPAWRLPWH